MTATAAPSRTELDEFAAFFNAAHEHTPNLRIPSALVAAQIRTFFCPERICREYQKGRFSVNHLNSGGEFRFEKLHGEGAAARARAAHTPFPDAGEYPLQGADKCTFFSERFWKQTPSEWQEAFASAHQTCESERKSAEVAEKNFNALIGKRGICEASYSTGVGSEYNFVPDASGITDCGEVIRRLRLILGDEYLRSTARVSELVVCRRRLFSKDCETHDSPLSIRDALLIMEKLS